MRGCASEIDPAKLIMKSTLQSLRDAFVEDHRHLTRGLNRLLKTLRAGDVESGVQIAEELDRTAGPHIQFEEEVLYPEIARTRGSEFTGRLYDEHGQALRAIRTLLDADPEELPASAREQVIQDAQTGLDHAVSCGTLLSHLTTLPEEIQERLLGRLMELRREGRRWSEL